MTQFFFAHIDPLDSIDPECIKSVIRIADKLYFEIVDYTGQAVQRTKPYSQYLMTQIEQFQIPFTIQPEA